MSNRTADPSGEIASKMTAEPFPPVGPVEISVVTPAGALVQVLGGIDVGRHEALGRPEEHAGAIGRDGAVGRVEVAVTAVGPGGEQGRDAAGALIDVHARVGVRGHERLVALEEHARAVGRRAAALAADRAVAAVRARRHQRRRVVVPPCGAACEKRAERRASERSSPNPLQFSPKAEAARRRAATEYEVRKLWTRDPSFLLGSEPSARSHIGSRVFTRGAASGARFSGSTFGGHNVKKLWIPATLALALAALVVPAQAGAVSFPEGVASGDVTSTQSDSVDEDGYGHEHQGRGLEERCAERAEGLPGQNEDIRRS